MSQELIYTSAPRGLKPGTRGFCTVQSTQGMSQPLAERLEALSGYRHLFTAPDTQASLNPVNYSHLILTVGGRKHHVLSRIADAGQDYTQRSNKFAHHVVLDPLELPPGGPAWAMAHPGFMQTDWDGEPKLLGAGRRPPLGDVAPAVCRHWQELTGDAGWGGALAETAISQPARQACIFFKPGQNLLPLVAEALALLPAARRWQVTFSTWFTKLPAGVDCQWRFMLADSAEAKQARRQQHALLIDLTTALPEATGGPLVQAARTGVVPVTAAPIPRQVANAAAAPRAPSDAGLHAGPSMAPTALQDEYPLGALTPISSTQSPLLVPSKRGKPRKTVILAASIGALLGITSLVVGLMVLLPARSKQIAKTPDSLRDDERTSGNRSADANGNHRDTVRNNDESESRRPAGVPGDKLEKLNDDGSSGAASASTSSPQSDPKPKLAESAARAPEGDAKTGVVASNRSAVTITDSLDHEDGLVTAGPFADLERRQRRLDLPPDEIIDRIELGKLNASNPDDVKLGIEGWSQIADEGYVLSIQKDAGRQIWNIRLRTEGAVAPAKLGRFEIDHGSLFFTWEINRFGELKSRAWLRFCQLRMTADGKDILCFLRAPIKLEPESVAFEAHTRNVELELLGDPKAIKEERLGMDVKCIGIEAKVVKKSDREAVVAIPFEPGRDIEIRIQLKQLPNRLPSIIFENRYRYPVRNGEAQEDALSLAQVAKRKEQYVRDAAQQAASINNKSIKLKDLGEPPMAPAIDLDAPKRHKLNSEINASQQQKDFDEGEAKRCDALIAILNKLHGNIGVTVYYKLGPDLGDVVLAQTKDE